MNILSILNKILLTAVVLASVSCDKLEGDNSDYEFNQEQAKTDPSRLPDS